MLYSSSGLQGESEVCVQTSAIYKHIKRHDASCLRSQCRRGRLFIDHAHFACAIDGANSASAAKCDNGGHNFSTFLEMMDDNEI